MTRRRLNDDDKPPKWAWVEWGELPDPITPVVFNLLVRFKWWRGEERRERERYRKWLASARRKARFWRRSSFHPHPSLPPEEGRDKMDGK